MESPISPLWQGSVSLPSPDGKWIATIDDPREIGMGAPTRGLLRIGETQPVEDCNPSMVWSEDSRYLAVPKWVWHGRDSPNQRLIIICPERGWVRHAPGTYRVLELERFAEGVVHGYELALAARRPIRVDVRRVVSILG